MIRAIKTNLVAETTHEFPFGDRVILQGGNGTGKTMLLNALRLTLVGNAQDLGGKDQFAVVRAGSDLIHLGDLHRSPMAEVTFATGEVARWGVVAGRRPSHTPPPMPAVYPLDEVMGVIRGGSDSRLAFFLRFFCQQGLEVDKWKRIQGRIRTRKKDLKASQSRLDALAEVGIRHMDVAQRVRTLRLEHEEIQDEIEALEEQAKNIRDVLYVVLLRESSRIVAEVNEYLDVSMRTMEFAMDVAGTKIEMGLRRSRGDMMPLRYASGAQWVMLATAICGPLTKFYREKGLLCVTVIPDRSYDHRMSRALLLVADRLDGVVIFPRAVALPGRRNNRWLLIDLNEMESVEEEIVVHEEEFSELSSQYEVQNAS